MVKLSNKEKIEQAAFGLIGVKRVCYVRTHHTFAVVICTKIPECFITKNTARAS